MKVREMIEKSVRARRRGEPFTLAEFKKVGPPATVRRELQPLAQSGKLKVVADSVYFKPRQHELLGEMLPTVAKLVRALTVKQGHALQITGAEAANRLGLSTQVPVKAMYLTSGPSQRLKVGNLGVELRHKPSKELPAAGQVAGDVIQALRYLGPGAIEPAHVERLAHTLQPETKTLLRRLGRQLPRWMRLVIERL